MDEGVSIDVPGFSAYWRLMEWLGSVKNQLRPGRDKTKEGKRPQENRTRSLIHSRHHRKIPGMYQRNNISCERR